MPERALADSLATLHARGWLAGAAFASRGDELRAVREIARGGVGAGRVFDGHRNGIERLLDHRGADVPDDLRQGLLDGRHVLGVWGADPGPGDGDPAVLSDDRRTVSGAKVFCSGAGATDLAIVLVRRRSDAPPTLPVVVATRDPERVHVDRDWFVAAALAESHSHRVVFDRAEVIAVLGSEGTLTEEPWFSGDALRSTAVWGGAADAIVQRMVAAGVDLPDGEERVGRAHAIVGSVDAWLAAGLAAVEQAHTDARHPSPWATVAAMRLELTERLRALLRLAAEHGGSRALVHDAELHEARGALDLLLLQHRLAPAARRLGAEHGGAA